MKTDTYKYRELKLHAYHIRLKALFFDLALATNLGGALLSISAKYLVDFKPWLLFFLYHFLMAALAFLSKKLRSGRARDEIFFWLFGLAPGIYSWLFITSSIQEWSVYTVCSMGIVLQNILTIVWFPGSKKRMQMHIAMSLIAGTTLSFGGKYGFILVTAGAHAVCIAVATLMYYERIKSFNLFNEENYNSFRPLIPDQVYSASEKSAINSQTRYRNAFYLSSDWRGYQKISESLTAEEISELIGNYYDDINQVLGEHLAGTDFFSDWIADELMVIIPTDSEEQKAEIASKIVSACQQIGKLLNTAARYEMLDIDIGVSFGKSVIGFIGPKQHRKMTALGRNPGHSRRLEGVGKALREEFSNTMYLITNDPQIVEALKADSLPVRSKSIAIKDLGQTEVSFVAVLDDQPAVTCTDGIAA